MQYRSERFIKNIPVCLRAQRNVETSTVLSQLYDGNNREALLGPQCRGEQLLEPFAVVVLPCYRLGPKVCSVLTFSSKMVRPYRTY